MKFYSIFLCIIIGITSIVCSYAHFTQQWAVHIPGGSSVADEVARDHGFINHGLIFEDHYFFSHSGVAKRSLEADPEKKVKFAVDTRVSWAAQQKAKKRIKRDKRFYVNDQKWGSMWYLNRGNGMDMNVIPAWLEGVTGKGAVVSILDDGLEKDHPDLVKNYDPLASYDVNNQDSDPSPRYDMIDSNRHGTRCAGEVAAASNNSICSLGIAHGAQVGGVRMLDGDVTDAVEARSLSLNPQHIDIYSASWGPDDDGKTVDGPGELATRAFIEGVTKGRNGKGSIFIWASGNGGRDHDNCNCDGYTNSIYSLSISSAAESGQIPWYSEACSSTLAATYSSGAPHERQIVTTDLRHACTSSHTGTSASAPLAAGICALALQVNPNLTWRDMQHIVVRTARPQHLHSTDWKTNGAKRNVSHNFGYGLMDAYAMIKMARKWITVPEQHKCEISAPDAIKSIPARSVVSIQLQVTECEGVEILEHVQAKLTIYAQRRGDLQIQLASPMGTKVTLLAHRPNDNSRSGFNYWPFMSVHTWGESPFGTWELTIHNDGRLMGRATLQNWSLILYGTKKFSSLSPNYDESIKLNKNKPSRGSKKNKLKQKNLQKLKNQRPSLSTTKSSKAASKSKIKQATLLQDKNTAGDNNVNNIPSTTLKSKIKVPVSSNIITTTDFSPYFYAVSNSKLKLDHESMVKHYLKFVKNVTITYPIMIPSRDLTEKKAYKKSQKMKEKSRDINFKHDIKDFLPKATEKTSKELKANIKKWDLTLYGTATPPAIDVKKSKPYQVKVTKQYEETVTKQPEVSISELNNENILHNSIDSSPNWKGGAENRKDRLEVDENSDSSSCKNSNGNFCLECTPGAILYNGTCWKNCPEGYYDNRKELNTQTKNTTCVKCHYSCKACTGSMDYECTECYPDALIYTVSVLENYCYPAQIITEFMSEKWYYRVIFLTLGLCIMFLILALIYCKRKPPNGYKRVQTDAEEDESLKVAYNYKD